MALFTDGQINSLQDLERYESELLDVTSVERIDVTGKMALAQDLIGAEVITFLLKQSSGDPWNFPFSFQTSSARRALGVADVVVTEPLKRWHAWRSIELVYEDAYSNQLNDRYEAKRAQYAQRALGAANQFYQIGVGTVHAPVPRAADPLLEGVGGNLMSATYYVRVTWVSASAQEGAPSNVVSLQTGDDMQLLVSVASPPPTAAGWNVYVGSTPDGVWLQNDVPIGLSSPWLLPAPGVRLGRGVPQGQKPDRYLVRDRAIQRG